MSSMFKKKGGLAFKPKIPSARSQTATIRTTSTPITKPADGRVLHEAVPQDVEESSTNLQQISQSTQSDEATESQQTPSTRKSKTNRQDKDKDSIREGLPTPASTIESSIQPSSIVTHDVAQQSRRSTRRLSSTQRQTTKSAALSVERRNSTTENRVSVQTDDGTPQKDITASLSTEATDPEPSTTDRDTPTEAEHQPSTTVAAPKRTRKVVEVNKTQEGFAESDTAPKPKKRGRKSAQDGEQDGQTRPKKRKASTATGDNAQSRPRRPRSVTPEDAEDQLVDLQKLRMADLTKDLHIGKKFSRHDELRERERQARLKAKTEKDIEPTEETGVGTDVAGGTDQSGAAVSASSSASVPAPAPASGPQFRIVDGQIVVDQSSLVMDRHARAAAAQAGQDMETIEENDFTRLITSSSFMNTSKLKGPNIWNDEETELFYRGLRMFGTDFEMISKMFRGKQRRHIKLKYNREERHNPKRIDAALIGEKTIKIDIDEYQTHTGSEFEPVETIEAEQRKIQDTFEAERQRIVDEQAEIMRKKREELFADDEGNGDGGKKKKRGKKAKQHVQYGLNGEPITTDA